MGNKRYAFIYNFKDTDTIKLTRKIKIMNKLKILKIERPSNILCMRSH